MRGAVAGASAWVRVVLPVLVLSGPALGAKQLTLLFTGDNGSEVAPCG